MRLTRTSPHDGQRRGIRPQRPFGAPCELESTADAETSARSHTGRVEQDARSVFEREHVLVVYTWRTRFRSGAHHRGDIVSAERGHVIRIGDESALRA